MDRLQGVYEASNIEKFQQEDPLVSLESRWGPWCSEGRGSSGLRKGLGCRTRQKLGAGKRLFDSGMGIRGYWECCHESSYLEAHLAGFWISSLPRPLKGRTGKQPYIYIWSHICPETQWTSREQWVPCPEKSSSAEWARLRFCGRDDSVRSAIGLKGPSASLYLWIVCFSDHCVSSAETLLSTCTVPTLGPQIPQHVVNSVCISELAVYVIVSQLTVKRSVWKRTEGSGWVSKAMSKEKKVA